MEFLQLHFSHSKEGFCGYLGSDFAWFLKIRSKKQAPRILLIYRLLPFLLE